MRVLLSFLIVLTFLPLQAGAGCSMKLEVTSQESSSCHSQKKQVHQNKILSPENERSQKNCYYCQTGQCEMLPATEALKYSEFRGQGVQKSQIIIQALYTLDRPASIDLRGPPLGDRQQSLFQPHSWQSFYSIYII